MRYPLLLLVCSVFVLGGCLDDRPGIGFVQDADGNYLSQSPENMQMVYQQRAGQKIIEALERSDLRADVSFSRPPVYYFGGDEADISGWRWEADLPVAVDLIGTTAGAPAPTNAEIEVAQEAFHRWFRQHRSTVRVQTEAAFRFVPFEEAQLNADIAAATANGNAATTPTATQGNTTPPATTAAPVAAGGPPVVAQPAVPAAQAQPRMRRTYVVQEGDTLADISTVFYGTPQYWRRLVEANPGLDPMTMTVGMQLQIPMLER